MSKEAMSAVKGEISTIKSKVSSAPIREDLNAIKEDFRALRADTATLGQDLKVEGIKHASAATEELRERVSVAKDKGQAYYSDMLEFVKGNPGQSVAFAFFGGMIASLLLNRRG